MHRIITLAGFMLMSLKPFAQQNFQGEIVYNVSFPGEKDKTSIRALFGDQKIKVFVLPVNNQPYNKEDLMFDFNAGLSYEINNMHKSYRVKPLKKSSEDFLQSIHLLVPSPAEDRLQLGYQALAYHLPKPEKNGPSNFNASATLLYAKSLPYKIPEKYASIATVLLFTNGESVGFGIRMEMEMNKNLKDSFELSIVSITKKTVPDSLMALPKDYQDQYASEAADTEPLLADTTAIMSVDTIGTISEQLKTSNKNAGKTDHKKQTGSRQRKPANSKDPIKKVED